MEEHSDSLFDQGIVVAYIKTDGKVYMKLLYPRRLHGSMGIERN